MALHAETGCSERQATHACRRHQDGGVGSASSELERHCQLQWSRLDPCPKLREEVVLYAEARGYVAPKLGQVSKAREDRDDPMDVRGFGQWKGRHFQGKGEEPTGKGNAAGKDGAKSLGQSNTQKIQGQCWNCGENRSSIEGWLGKATAATEPRTIKFFWKGERRPRQDCQRWQERQIQRCESTCLVSAD